MTLKWFEYDGDRKGCVLTECPCGYVFDEDEERSQHIGEHNPEDFGLSPKRTGQVNLGQFEDGQGVSP